MSEFHTRLFCKCGYSEAVPFSDTFHIQWDNCPKCGQEKPCTGLFMGCKFEYVNSCSGWLMTVCKRKGERIRKLRILSPSTWFAVREFYVDTDRKEINIKLID